MVIRIQAALIIIALSVTLTAKTATGETLRYQLFAPGGEAANDAFRVYSIVGQPAIGSASGVNIRHTAGYVHLVRDYFIGALVPVAITSFDAVIVERHIELTWTIGDTDGIVGFNVYRTEDESMGFQPLHDELLSAADGFSYRDDTVRPGQRYTYRIGAMDSNGETVSVIVRVDIPVWQTDLSQNFPNPFNPTTRINYYLAAPERVSLKIYDITGSLIRTLIDKCQSFGQHDIVWDGRNNQGARVSSGFYFYRLSAGTHAFTKKMTLLK